MATQDPQGIKIVCQNKKARHNYNIEDSFEAGLVLKGTEVKSLRNGKANLVDSYATIDGNEAWSRVSPEGHPALYCSQDGGDTWFRQDIGLPMRNAWFTVLRQGLTTDCLVEAGLYFGTTSGSLWMSDNEGNSWRQIAVHLPRILAVETGVILKK